MLEEEKSLTGDPCNALVRDESVLFNDIVGLFRQDRLTDAELLLDRLLERRPNHVEALHLLGLVAARTRRSERAVDLLSRAIHENGIEVSLGDSASGNATRMLPHGGSGWILSRRA